MSEDKDYEDDENENEAEDDENENEAELKVLRAVFDAECDDINAADGLREKEVIGKYYQAVSDGDHDDTNPILDTDDMLQNLRGIQMGAETALSNARNTILAVNKAIEFYAEDKGTILWHRHDELEYSIRRFVFFLLDHGKFDSEGGYHAYDKRFDAVLDRLFSRKQKFSEDTEHVNDTGETTMIDELKVLSSVNNGSFTPSNGSGIDILFSNIHRYAEGKWWLRDTPEDKEMVKHWLRQIKLIKNEIEGKKHRVRRSPEDTRLITEAGFIPDNVDKTKLKEALGRVSDNEYYLLSAVDNALKYYDEEGVENYGQERIEYSEEEDEDESTEKRLRVLDGGKE